jgi:hypothetical protein
MGLKGFVATLIVGGIISTFIWIIPVASVFRGFFILAVMIGSLWIAMSFRPLRKKLDEETRG